MSLKIVFDNNDPGVIIIFLMNLQNQFFYSQIIYSQNKFTGANKFYQKYQSTIPQDECCNHAQKSKMNIHIQTILYFPEFF